MNQEKKVLAMYDVRGIQDYIFRTNRVKDIIGASLLVEHIIENAFASGCSQAAPQGRVISDWETDRERIAILREDDVAAQVLFIGGGNAYILYRSRELCMEVSRRTARYVLEHTYSLQLATAVIDMTEDYFEDYKNLNAEMTRIKQAMPASRYLGALPVVAVDAMTGYPLTAMDGEERVSTETSLKRSFVPAEGREKHFDNLITQKGTESMLAIVHLDGNNLGMRIRSLMEAEELKGASYEACVARMRQISANIRVKFQDTYAAMEQYLMDWVRSDANQLLDKSGNPRYLRKIIVAGDDVTFVCNARVALSLVEFFVKDISGKTMLGEESEENLRKYGFSVCAGIACINSHFPFSTGYQVAKACCESAKQRAKAAEHAGADGRIGSWVDFQICRNVQAKALDMHREKNYVTGDGKRLLRRPYYISSGLSGEELDAKKENQAYDLEEFRRAFHYFSNGSSFPRSQVKELRNTYPYGEKEMDSLTVFLRSRGRRLPDGTDEAFNTDGTAKWYDVLEFMDYYTDMREGESQNADQD